ncbi:MAG TPA: zf-HC2 domain-containing protein [Candidatus Dormibacteraeota bacterium]|jgi:predicted anti-sigma-YlaC factor YlaD|nr:zf-HC2 domain-containing protein [Candidatus Dormibacteraeota bacterium]
MKLDCKHIWRELSNYLEGEVSEEVRRDVEAHVAQCRHCAALLDSTHNVLVLVADERRMDLPIGFNSRLRERLEREMSISGPE